MENEFLDHMHSLNGSIGGGVDLCCFR